ncbi:MAG: glycine--tRNA ligase subunit beta [Candidatus Angelobacter sp. Gp1-AA117]|nr:MAG: glycine--tRNA ligase subunit beta [Candidatus Angelobacter sp. Gp1-AA117]
MPDFLLEIGCEEIPARMIDAAREELAKRVIDMISRERLGTSPGISAFSTPRRLAVLASGIAASQPDIEEQVTGPSVKVAFKDGHPTPAAEAFAKKVGVEVGRLERVTNPKGEYIAATVTRKGRSASEVLSEFLGKEISAIYWPKNMYWRAGKPERFVRPVRWLVAMIGSDIVPLEIAGIRAASHTRGHRLLNPGEQTISAPNQYSETLSKAGVIVTPSDREYRIRKALDAATRAIPGARWREDAELLKTVVNLTEWSSAILGSFDHQFLSLPEEVLVTVMRDHQKYFAIEDESGKLAPYFLAVLNTDGDPDGLIRHGNERVLRARFNDARFFWDIDQKTTLKHRTEMLKAVTFQKDLGSYAAKADRVVALISKLAVDLAGRGTKLEREAAEHAGRLAKADLTTELVKEFTELQGIVGGLYARAQGLPHSLADAIYDQYKPVSMEDAPPRTLEGAVLSIADKADTIAGMFALGLVPSGSKDPFALRRQANGIVKTIAEHKLPVSITRLLAEGLGGYHGSEASKKFTQTGEAYSEAVRTFFYERLEFYLREVLGFAYGVVNATLIADADDVVDAVARAQALAKVRPSVDFEAIAVSFKRMKNILRQAAEAGRSVAQPFAPVALKEDAEKTLAAQIPQVAANVNALRGKRQYEEALLEIARLRPSIDAFFDKVMVMVEDDALRANRLGLLQTLLQEFSSIADFSAV